VHGLHRRVLFIVINFAVDLLYGFLDPRARAG